MKDKKINQIMKYIKRTGSITKMQAAEKFSEYGLSEKISRLRKRGMNIEVDMIPRPGKQPYAKYRFIRE